MIDCIIPAAGLSKRMLQWKPLLPLYHKTIIEWSVSNAIAGGCRVILVVGTNGKRLQQLFSNNDTLTIIENQNYQEGLLSSIKVGLSKVKTSHFFISLADMPFILPDIYQKLQKFKSTKVIFPIFQGKTGHPVLIPNVFTNKIHRFQNNNGLKPLLVKLPHQTVSISSQGVLIDIDTPENYDLAKSQAESFLGCFY